MLHLMEQANDFIGTATQISAILTPYLPLAGIILGGLLVGAFQVWNRKRGAVETRAPDVNEIWQQQIYQNHELDMERRWRRRLENFSHELVRIFRAYVKRVQNGGSTDLTPHEKLFHDTDPPSGEINVSNK